MFWRLFCKVKDRAFCFRPSEPRYFSDFLSITTTIQLNHMKTVSSRLHVAWRYSAIAVGVLTLGLSQASAFVLGPTTPGKWGPAAMGTGATVTWSLMPSGVAMDSGTSVALASFMPAGFKAQIEAAFAAWSAVANITFVEVADSGHAFNVAGASGDIRIGGHVFDGPSGVLAHGYYPPGNGVTAAGDIHFDTAELWKIGFGGPGFDIFTVAAHEIGHAIGLDHTAVPSSLMNPYYTESLVGPQADDIAGARFIYGPAVRPPTDGPDTGSSVALLGLALIVLASVRRRTA